MRVPSFEGSTGAGESVHTCLASSNWMLVEASVRCHVDCSIRLLEYPSCVASFQNDQCKREESGCLSVHVVLAKLEVTQSFL